MAHEGIFGLQVKDVELVDVRRHDHQRALEHRGGGGRVLNQLEQRVLEHHCARRHRHVAADLELRFVGLRDAAFLHIAQQVGQPFVQCTARAFNDGLLSIGIERQEVGRRQRVNPLHNGEPQAFAHRFTDLGRIDHTLHRAGRQQIGVCHQQVGIIAGPGVAGKAAVGQGRKRAAAGVVTKALPFAREFGLNVGQDFRCHAHRNGSCGEIGVHFDTLLSTLLD